MSEKKFPKVAKWLDRVREVSNEHYNEAYEFLNKKSKQPVQAKLWADLVRISVNKSQF